MPSTTRKASRTPTSTHSKKSAPAKAPRTPILRGAINSTTVAPKPVPKQDAVDAAKANGPNNEKPAKIAKVVRDSFTMPEADYGKLAELKSKCMSAGVSVKKSELLRMGLHLLEALPLDGLTTAVAALEKVKTGRKALKKAAKSGKLVKGH